MRGKIYKSFIGFPRLERWVLILTQESWTNSGMGQTRLELAVFLTLSRSIFPDRFDSCARGYHAEPACNLYFPVCDIRIRVPDWSSRRMLVLLSIHTLSSLSLVAHSCASPFHQKILNVNSWKRTQAITVARPRLNSVSIQFRSWWVFVGCRGQQDWYKRKTAFCQGRFLLGTR